MGWPWDGPNLYELDIAPAIRRLDIGLECPRQEPSEISLVGSMNAGRVLSFRPQHIRPQALNYRAQRFRAIPGGDRTRISSSC